MALRMPPPEKARPTSCALRRRVVAVRRPDGPELLVFHALRNANHGVPLDGVNAVSQPFARASRTAGQCLA